MRRISLIFSFFLILTGCKTVQKNTLREMDISSSENNISTVFVKPKTDEEIRNAYAEYLKHTAKDDNSRMAAINRLAELEFELSNRIQQENESSENNPDGELDDHLYDARLNKTIELLETSLRDYPNSPNNDKILYQLSKTFAQQGAHNKSILSLSSLVKKFPKSNFYTESQFRLAEEYFSKQDYIGAEDAYTEVIIDPKTNVFYEKAVFKRGWARFKQELYIAAIDDFMEAIEYHQFDDAGNLDKPEQVQFDEYFRAIGLAFSYLGGTDPIFDYFNNRPDFKYIFQAYTTVSRIYLQQERFSDSADTLEQFTKHYPVSEHIPQAHLTIITIWKDSGFTNQLFKAINSFYSHYNPGSEFWKINNTPTNIQEKIDQSLKEYVLLMSSHFHNQYQNNHSPDDFKKADKWYKRYLEHYANYARQDNIYFLYGELLSENKLDSKAIGYYELAAYDNELLINKKASYATIIVTDRLINQNHKELKQFWMNKHIDYALLFGQMYPKDKESANIILHAAELSYSSSQFEKAIDLTELIPDNAMPATIYNANTIKAESFFNLGRYAEAESIYTTMLQFDTKRKDREITTDKLALAIYKQGEQESNNGNGNAAVRHFIRLTAVAPGSAIAATGLYDAIAYYMSKQEYENAIINIKKFQQLYPDHELGTDIVKKLSVAYLNSNQGIKAAREFERISTFENDREIKMAALWQAAELYESKKDFRSAIRSYKEYVKEYKTPYPQYAEAMSRLVILYSSDNNPRNANYWRNQLIKSDKNTARKNKTDRSKFLVSKATLYLAEQSYSQFKKHDLIRPLKTNLLKKKKAMKKAVRLFGQASTYGIQEITTQSTYSIASIYYEFSDALLNSERPVKLNDDELEQYEILLEDQAFPFEEKAIEFYETNLSHIKDGIFNEWIRKSLAQLKILFPARYKRKTKVDPYINVIF